MLVQVKSIDASKPHRMRIHCGNVRRHCAGSRLDWKNAAIGSSALIRKDW